MSVEPAPDVPHINKTICIQAAIWVLGGFAAGIAIVVICEALKKVLS